MTGAVPDTNLYASSAASNQIAVDDETYQPKFLAWSGRIGRVRYLAYGTAQSLLWYLAVLVATIPLAMMGAMMSNGLTAMIVLMVLAYVVLVVGQVSLGRRRLHDLGKSSWWLLLWLVPLVNFGLAIYLLFFPGTKGSNTFGPQPTKNGPGVIFMAFGFLLIIFLIGVLAAIAIPQYQTFVDRARAKSMQQQGIPTLPDASEAPAATPASNP